jgi:hypothetical protein
LQQLLEICGLQHWACFRASLKKPCFSSSFGRKARFSPDSLIDVDYCPDFTGFQAVSPDFTHTLPVDTHPGAATPRSN